MLKNTEPLSPPESTDVVLRSGSTCLLRPITRDDAPALLRLHEQLSPESLRFRFFTTPRLDLARMVALADVDYRNQFGLVAECGGHLIAVACFYRDASDPTRAEVAFTIAETLQGQGLGTRLLERLAEIARDHGVTVFDAYVLPDNVRMLQLFVDSGFEMTRRFDGGVLRVTMSLAETAAFRERAAARAQSAATASLKPFFEPRAIAVVGANRRRGRIGAEILHNLRAAGFAGSIVPVNPESDAIDGLAAFPRVSDIPGDVDLAVIVVRADEVSAVVDDCIAKGVRGVIVISAGFADAGDEGRARELAVIDRIRGAGIRLIGPNCMGVLNTDPAVRMNATFSPVFPPAGGVAMLTQSGALGLAILDYAARLNVGISGFASIGNKADVSGNDLIQYWADDRRTSVILLHLESFGNPRKFGQIARRIARRKPIVAMRVGRPRGEAAARTTSAGLAADAALFRQAGVIRTATLEELFDVAALVAHQPVPRGPRVAILTNAGGAGMLAADACEANGLEIATLGDETVCALETLLGGGTRLANPVNMVPSAKASDYRRALAALLADERVDSVLVIFIPPLVIDSDAVAAAIVEAASVTPEKAVAAIFMRSQGAPAALAPIPSYLFPESAAVALAHVTRYGEWLRKPIGDVPRFADVHGAVARASVERALARGGGWLMPLEALGVLYAAGIPIAASQMAAREDEAISAARAIGFPVVLKAVGATIVHKQEDRAVRLDLGDEASVGAAYRELTARLADRMSGVLVQQMIRVESEFTIAVEQDSTFGPLIVCGSGEAAIDRRDVVFRLHPLTDLDADEMIDELASVLIGRRPRGSTPADLSPLRDVLLRVSALLDECPEIVGLEMHPLAVAHGGGVALDARVRVDQRRVPPRSRRIAY